MNHVLNPYIAFDGDAAEAMQFYHRVFGGELHISTYRDYGSPEGPTPDHVMHAVLTIDDGRRVMGWDVPDRVPYEYGRNVSLYVAGDGAELERQFDELAEGGQVTLPLTRQEWGDKLGSVRDRFGVCWMFKITGTSHDAEARR